MKLYEIVRNCMKLYEIVRNCMKLYEWLVDWGMYGGFL